MITLIMIVVFSIIFSIFRSVFAFARPHYMYHRPLYCHHHWVHKPMMFMPRRHMHHHGHHMF